MRVLIVTSDWPGPGLELAVPFLVEQVNSIRSLGIEVDVFSFRGQGKPWRYYLARRRLRRGYDLGRYDLLHAHFGQAGLTALPSPVPVVVTFHGSDLQGIVGPRGRYTWSGRLLRAISRAVSRRAAQVVLVAAHLRQHLDPGISFEVHPCGVDLERFKPTPQTAARRALDLPLHQPIVLFGANPENPIKRWGLASAALDLLPRQLAPRVIQLVGFPREEVPLLMSACDLMLLTSHHEGSPTVIKEAMACRLPIVSLPVGDVPELLASVDSCTLVTEATAEDLAAAMTPLLESRPRSRDSREKVAHLSNEKVAERLLDLYRRTIDRHHAA